MGTSQKADKESSLEGPDCLGQSGALLHTPRGLTPTHPSLKKVLSFSHHLSQTRPPRHAHPDTPPPVCPQSARLIGTSLFDPWAVT